VTIPADVEAVERLHRVLRLTMDRPKCREVMVPDQHLRCPVHCIGIEWARDEPGLAELKRQGRPAVYDAVEIAPPDAGEACVPILRFLLTMNDCNWSGTKLGVECFHQAEGSEVLLDIDVAAHRK